MLWDFLWHLDIQCICSRSLRNLLVKAAFYNQDEIGLRDHFGFFLNKTCNRVNAPYLTLGVCRFPCSSSKLFNWDYPERRHYPNKAVKMLKHWKHLSHLQRLKPAICPRCRLVNHFLLVHHLEWEAVITGLFSCSDAFKVKYLKCLQTKDLYFTLAWISGGTGRKETDWWWWRGSSLFRQEVNIKGKTCQSFIRGGE